MSSSNARRTSPLLASRLGREYHVQFDAQARRLRMTMSPEASQEGMPGYVHGGFGAALLDEVMADVGHAIDGCRYLTGTLSLRYRRQLPLNAEYLLIEAWRSDPESRPIHRVHGRILLPGGEAAVTARGLFVRLRE